MKTAIITGGANGMGRALAETLSARYQIILIDQDEASLDSFKTSYPSTQTFPCNLSDEHQSIAVVEDILSQNPRIDLLINSAGVSLQGPLKDCKLEDINWLTQINYLALVRITRLILPAMVANRSGHIVNLSSGAGLFGVPNRSIYCGAKFAINGFSQALRHELYGSGVKVQWVCMGAVRTDMYKRNRYTHPDAIEADKRYLNERGISPEKAAQAILNGMRKNKGQIVFTKDGKNVAFLSRWFPRFLAYVLTRYKDRLPGNR